MTILVPLTQGKTAVIDDVDWPLVEGYKWRAVRDHRNFYAAAWGKEGPAHWQRREVLMHRLILGVEPNERVDHKSGDGLDNRRENLRLATPTQNSANSRRSLRKKGAYKGAYWRERQKRWAAAIRYQNHLYHLGDYKTEEDAARAYDQKAREYFGEYAHCNFPPG